MEADEFLDKIRGRVDEFVGQLKARRAISCGGAGCCGCCRGEIALHPREAQRLLPHVTPAAWERVRRQHELYQGAPEGAAQRLARCPLLEPDGRCGVYAERPLACRAYVVVTPVDWCYPERAGTRDVALVAELVGALPHAWRGLDEPVGTEAQVSTLRTELFAELERRGG